MIDSARQTLRLPMERALELEHRLFQSVITGQRTSGFFIWQSDRPCLVAPRGMQRIFNGISDESRAKRWPLRYRMTGGDVTPQGPGILNLSTTFLTTIGQEVSLQQQYQELCKPIIATLAEFGISAHLGNVHGSYCDGSRNVVIDGKKFAGTALRLSRSKADITRQVVFGHAVMTVMSQANEGIAEINQLYAGAGLERLVDPQMAIGLAGKISGIAEYSKALSMQVGRKFASFDPGDMQGQKLSLTGICH